MDDEKVTRDYTRAALHGSTDALLTLINTERHEAYLLGVSAGMKFAFEAIDQTAEYLNKTTPDVLKIHTGLQNWKKEIL